MSWTVDATGDSGRALQGLAYLIASCAQFRTVTGAANATAALAFIHEEADDTSDSTADRPRCIIVEDEYRRSRSEGGNKSSGGSFLVSFEFTITTAYINVPSNEMAELKNKCDQIAKEMEDLGGTGTGYFSGCTHFLPKEIIREGEPEVMTEIKVAGGAEVKQTFAACVYRVTWTGVPA